MKKCKRHTKEKKIYGKIQKCKQTNAQMISSNDHKNAEHKNNRKARTKVIKNKNQLQRKQ